MALESASFIDGLVATNPVAGDNVSQGDDHLRLVKSVLKATFPGLDRAIYLEKASVDLASATTPDLSTPASNYINITGTTQIDGFATEPAGFTRVLRFNAALTLNYNGTSLILPTGDDILTEAGDHAIAVSLGSGNWRIAAYFRASGKPVGSEIPTIASGDVGKVLKATDDSPKSYGWDWAVPIGSIVAWPTNTPPTGWLECDGSEVSRTTYAALFAVIGEAYGDGDDSTTFNLPDYRGEFLRGWAHGTTNDPDKATRTNRGDTTTGDNVGTKQASQFTLHGHPFTLSVSGGDTDAQGGLTMNSDNQTDFPAFTGDPSGLNGEQIGGSGGNETRPRNVNVMWIIKAA